MTRHHYIQEKITVVPTQGWDTRNNTRETERKRKGKKKGRNVICISVLECENKRQRKDKHGLPIKRIHSIIILIIWGSLVFNVYHSFNVQITNYLLPVVNSRNDIFTRSWRDIIIQEKITVVPTQGWDTRNNTREREREREGKKEGKECDMHICVRMRKQKTT